MTEMVPVWAVQPHHGCWEEWEVDILARPCMCCGTPGHYQHQLEDHIRRTGRIEPVFIEGGNVQDGHHRVLAARRLGIEDIPTETKADADARWVRDHGCIPWEERKVGDLLASDASRVEGSVRLTP